MDILTQLDADHQQFRIWLRALDADELGSAAPFFGEKGAKTQTAAFKILKDFMPELHRHEEIENCLFHQALIRKSEAARELLHGMKKEQLMLEHLIKHFRTELALSAEKPTRRLIETLEHFSALLLRHMLWEEQYLFPLAKAVFSESELDLLGHQAEDPAFAEEIPSR